MNCPNCETEMVVAKATDYGEEYYWCRKCKKELKEMIVLEENCVALSGMPPLPKAPEPCTCTSVYVCQPCRDTWVLKIFP